jgi:hypothetical protein
MKRLDPEMRGTWIVTGIVTASLAYDLYALWQMHKRERNWKKEVWSDDDDTALGFVHDAYRERSGDVPPVSPVAGDEVADPVLADEDLTTPESDLHADSGD